MIRFLGPSASFCDGLSRREMLRFGGLSMAGVSLPQLVTAQPSFLEQYVSQSLWHHCYLSPLNVRLCSVNCRLWI